MPPKKKRGPVNIAKKHLLENFSNFPIACEDFLNGHILCIFALKCDNSSTMKENFCHYSPLTLPPLLWLLMLPFRKLLIELWIHLFYMNSVCLLYFKESPLFYDSARSLSFITCFFLTNLLLWKKGICLYFLISSQCIIYFPNHVYIQLSI